MIEKDLARDAIGMFGTVAAIMIEDVHPDLTVMPTEAAHRAALATTLERLGADLSALGAAAAVLARSAP